MTIEPNWSFKNQLLLPPLRTAQTKPLIAILAWRASQEASASSTALGPPGLHELFSQTSPPPNPDSLQLHFDYEHLQRRNLNLSSVKTSPRNRQRANRVLLHFPQLQQLPADMPLSRTWRQSLHQPCCTRRPHISGSTLDAGRAV